MPLTDTTYTGQFKPALLFGIPPLKTLGTRMYMTKLQEDYNINGAQMVEVSPNVLSNNTNTDTGFCYQLETANSTVAPTVRPVDVKGKESYKYNFLIEPKLGATGVAVVMFQEAKINGTSMVHCNIRVLPFSTCSQLHSIKNETGKLVIDIPTEGVVKLNVTIAPSNTGEVLYKTQKTDLVLTGITEADKVILSRELNFEISKLVAQISGSMLQIIPSKEENKSGFTSNYAALLPNVDSTTIKELILGVGIIGNAAIDLVGEVVVRQIDSDWRFSGQFIEEVLN